MFHSEPTAVLERLASKFQQSSRRRVRRRRSRLLHFCNALTILPSPLPARCSYVAHAENFTLGMTHGFTIKAPSTSVPQCVAFFSLCIIVTFDAGTLISLVQPARLCTQTTKTIRKTLIREPPPPQKLLDFAVSRDNPYRNNRAAASCLTPSNCVQKTKYQ